MCSGHKISFSATIGDHLNMYASCTIKQNSCCPVSFRIGLFTPDYLPFIFVCNTQIFFVINQVSNRIMNNPVKFRAAKCWMFKVESLENLCGK